MSRSRLLDMVTAAVLIVGLGYVVAVSSRTLPGGDGGDALFEMDLAVPVGIVAAVQWAVLAIAGLGALLMLVSVARAARGEEFDYRRFRVLLYWIAAFVLALRIRPPEEEGAVAALPQTSTLPGETSIPSGAVIEAEWMFAALLVAVAIALVVRLVMARGQLTTGASAEEDVVGGHPPDLLAEPIAAAFTDDPRSRIINVYAGFERESLDAGVGRLLSETPRAHARRVRRSLQLDQADVEALEGEYESVRFGDFEAGVGQAERAESAWQRIKDRLAR